MKRTRHITALTFVLMLVLSACNLSTNSGTPRPDLEATAVYQTIEARNAQANNNGGNEAAIPTNTIVQQSNQLVQPTATLLPTATNQPLPTKQPTQASSGGQTSQSLSLTLGSLNQVPTDVYFGNCGPNDPTTIGIGLTVTPNSQVSTVVLWYEISSQNGGWGPFWKNMSLSNVGDYYSEIDIGADGPNTLGNTGGWVNYWVEATANDGSTYTSSVYSTNITYCPPSAVGPPPVNNSPFINFFTGPAQVAPSDYVEISWEIFDATCGVYLDGMPVGEVDFYSYFVPSQNPPAEYYHYLVAYGGDCNNPTMTDADLTIQVVQSQAQAPAAPTNLIFTGWSNDTANFEWVDNANNEDEYHMWIGSQILNTLAANSVSGSLNLGGLDCNQKQVNISVTASNAVGESVPSNTLIVDVPCPPSPPWIEKGVNEATYSTFYFYNTNSADSFNIYVDGQLYHQNYAGSSYTIQPACGSEIQVYVTGVNFAGESGPSNSISITGTCP